MKEAGLGLLAALALTMGVRAGYTALVSKAISDPQPPQGFEMTPVVPAGKFDLNHPLTPSKRGLSGVDMPSP
jgi:hypothetical protein